MIEQSVQIKFTIMNSHPNKLARLTQSCFTLLTILLAVGLAPVPAAFAANVTKDAAGTDLTAAASWAGGVGPAPTAADVAVWDVGSLGSGLSLNSGTPSWLGIKVNAGASDPISIGSGGTLTLGTGGIDMSAATINATISSGLTLASGGQVWNVATGRILTQNTGTFTRSAGASLLVDKSVNTGTVTASPTLVNSIVPWAAVKSSGTAANNSANGYTFATVSGGNLIPYTTATAVTTSYPANNAAVNYDWSATGTQAQIGSSRSANTIRFTGTAAVTQTANSTQTETMNALMNAGGGTVTLGGGQTMNIQAGSANELVLAAMTSGIIINGPIINTSGGVTIVGPNTVTFGGANSYTGPTRVNSGTLKLGAANRIPDGSAVTVNGTLDMASFSDTIGGLDGSGTVDNSAAGTPTLTVNSTANSTFSGLIKNTAGTLAINKVGAGTLTISGANNTYSGTTTIGTGAGAAVIRATATQALGTGTIQTDLTGNASTARLELMGGISLNNAITLAGRNNSSVAIQSISGNNTLSGTITYAAGGASFTIQSDADTLTLGTAGGTAINGSGTRNLYLQGAGNGLVIGNILYASALSKAGAGTWTLSGANTYAGPTSISTGTLALSGSGSIASSTGISIAAGATLDVSALSGDFALGASQGLSASGTASAATINGGAAQTISAGSRPITLTYDGSHPALTVSQGSLSLNGNAFTVNGTALASGANTSYTLVQQTSGNITSAGTYTASGTAIGSHVGTITVSGGAVNLNVDSAPVIATSVNNTVTSGLVWKISILSLSNAAAWSDPDGDSLTLSSVGPTSTLGTNVTTDGTYIYYQGAVTASDSFNYVITDGTLTAIGTVNLATAPATGPSITSPTVNGSGNPTFGGHGIPGYVYGVESATSLGGPWIDAGSVTASGNGSWSFTDINQVNPPTIFYRLYYPYNPSNPPQ
jgi:autotransporter-associated beta strand protein